MTTSLDRLTGYATGFIFAACTLRVKGRGAKIKNNNLCLLLRIMKVVLLSLHLVASQFRALLLCYPAPVPELFLDKVPASPGALHVNCIGIVTNSSVSHSLGVTTPLSVGRVYHAAESSREGKLHSRPAKLPCHSGVGAQVFPQAPAMT